MEEEPEEEEAPAVGVPLVLDNVGEWTGDDQVKLFGLGGHLHQIDFFVKNCFLISVFFYEHVHLGK